MEYRKLGLSQLNISVVSLGTWAFGGDLWWGKQDDKDSMAVLDAAIKRGLNCIDTAPVYGRGRSERIIGAFIKKQKLRDKVIIATKVGLGWRGSTIFHNLKRKAILKEVDESRMRLNTEYFDLYQVHWPDPDTPIRETAETMYELYQKGVIKAVGVSNYSVKQMEEFRKYSPLHSLQPQYSMFERSIEAEIVPFCIENNIAIIAYAPLYSGILTGKFFFDKVSIPNDTSRKMKKADLEEPLFSINKKSLSQLKDIAANYGKTLTQLVINWNFSQRGITSSIVRTRNLKQLDEDLGSIGWKISDNDLQKIAQILKEREVEIGKNKE